MGLMKAVKFSIS